MAATDAPAPRSAHTDRDVVHLYPSVGEYPHQLVHVPGSSAAEVAAGRAPKLTGWDWYNSLGSPKFWVAPMVNQSELAFRLLTREYGAQVTVTPMIHARIFTGSPKFRRQVLEAWPRDAPLLVQFCANDANVLVDAAKQVQHRCAGVDLNLGCPQLIARKGFYGAYLLEHTTLVVDMVRRCANELDVPITVKIRLLPKLEDTLALVEALTEAGASVVTVHGRTREERKDKTAVANWEAIAAIKAVARVPIIANGGMFTRGDVARCLAATGADGVMLSEAILDNPGVFSGGVHLPTGAQHNVLHMAWRYVEIAAAVGATWSNMHGHLMKMLYGGLAVHADLNEAMNVSNRHQLDFDHVRSVLQQLATRYGVELVDTPAPVELLPPESVAGDRVLWWQVNRIRESTVRLQMGKHRAHLSQAEEAALSRTANRAIVTGVEGSMDGSSVRVPLLPLPLDPAAVAAAMPLPPVPVLPTESAAAAAGDGSGPAPIGATARHVVQWAEGLPALAAGARHTPPYVTREVAARCSGDRAQLVAMADSGTAPLDLAFPQPGMWYFRYAARVAAAAVAPCEGMASALADLALERSVVHHTHVMRDVLALKAYLSAKHGSALGITPSSGLQEHKAAPPTGARGAHTTAAPAGAAGYSMPPNPPSVPAVSAPARPLPPPVRLAAEQWTAVRADVMRLPLMSPEQALALAAGGVTLEDLGCAKAGGGDIFDEVAGEGADGGDIGTAALFGDDSDLEEE